MKRFLALLLVCCAAVPPAFAQAKFPNRPVRVVVGFGPGSAADIIGRILTTRLQESMPAGVIVDAKTGAAGLVATQEVARAAPDGYTILLAAQSQISLPPNTNRNFPADLLKELMPIAEVAGTDLSFVVSPQHVPAATIPEYLRWAATLKPLFLGDFGAGSITDLTAAFFANINRLQYEPIHYKSAADIWTGLYGGDIRGIFLASGTVIPNARAGKIRVLATTGDVRSTLLRQVPTFKESGLPDLTIVSWFGVFAPARTPPDVAAALTTAFVGAARDAAVRARLEDAGFRGTGIGPDEFARMIQEDTARWGRVVKAIGFKASD